MIAPARPSSSLARFTPDNAQPAYVCLADRFEPILRGIGEARLRVWRALAVRASECRGFAWLHRDELARECGCHPSTVRRALEVLEDRGLIARFAWLDRTASGNPVGRGNLPGVRRHLVLVHALAVAESALDGRPVPCAANTLADALLFGRREDLEGLSIPGPWSGSVPLTDLQRVENRRLEPSIRRSDPRTSSRQVHSTAERGSPSTDSRRAHPGSQRAPRRRSGCARSARDAFMDEGRGRMIEDEEAFRAWIEEENGPDPEPLHRPRPHPASAASASPPQTQKPPEPEGRAHPSPAGASLNGGAAWN